IAPAREDADAGAVVKPARGVVDVGAPDRDDRSGIHLQGLATPDARVPGGDARADARGDRVGLFRRHVTRARRVPLGGRLEIVTPPPEPGGVPRGMSGGDTTAP